MPGLLAMSLPWLSAQYCCASVRDRPETRFSFAAVIRLMPIVAPPGCRAIGLGKVPRPMTRLDEDLGLLRCIVPVLRDDLAGATRVLLDVRLPPAPTTDPGLGHVVRLEVHREVVRQVVHLLDV